VFLAAKIEAMRDFLAEAQALHASSIVLDAHVDTSLRFLDEGWQWTSDDAGIGQLSAHTALAGGLSGAFFAAWPNPSHCLGKCAERTRLLIQSVHDQAARYPAALTVCTTAAQIRRAKADHRFAAMIGIEGGYAIEDNLDRLQEFFARGARYMTLTWVKSLAWCGSSGDEDAARGLTEFGRGVVHEMNRLGMLVDVSHVSDAAFRDVLETSSKPVIASHSSARAICSAGRNLTDEMAVALASKGGLVMVNFYAAFLSDAWKAAYAAQRPEVEAALNPVREEYQRRKEPMPFTAQIATIRRYARMLPPVPLSVLVDHFDHLLRLVGPEHVGIGTDFDGMALSVEGMESAADLPKLTAGLLERGWSPHELKGMLGENLLRVLEHAQEAATA
jgi:membrane dipeptidase